MNLDNPLYCVRVFRARVKLAQLIHDPDTFELDREIEAFALDMLARDPEFEIMEFYEAVYENDANMEHRWLATERPNIEVLYRKKRDGLYVLLVGKEEYGSFGAEEGVKEAKDHWVRQLATGHPLTGQEKRLCRRDNYLGYGITFREYLGGPGWTPDLWEVFQSGRRVGRYRTERGALRRVERLKEETRTELES